jgi:transposase
MERLEQLMTIPAVGPITAPTWALQVGGVQQFSRSKRPLAAANYAQPSTVRQTSSNTRPLSEQRNV